MEPEAGGIADVFKLDLIKSKEFQMGLRQIYSDSCPDSQCFSLGGEQTVKL